MRSEDYTEEEHRNNLHTRIEAVQGHINHHKGELDRLTSKLNDLNASLYFFDNYKSLYIVEIEDKYRDYADYIECAYSFSEAAFTMITFLGTDLAVDAEKNCDLMKGLLDLQMMRDLGYRTDNWELETDNRIFRIRRSAELMKKDNGQTEAS